MKVRTDPHTSGWNMLPISFMVQCSRNDTSPLPVSKTTVEANLLPAAMATRARSQNPTHIAFSMRARELLYAIWEYAFANC